MRRVGDHDMRWHLLVGFALALASSNAAVATEFFVGRWTSNPGVCSGDDASARPMIVTENSLHRSALSCRIGKMYKAGRAVYIQAYCSVDGRMSTVPITLEERGPRLGVIWNNEQMEEMQRCP